jgi:hypothetical protein
MWKVFLIPEKNVRFESKSWAECVRWVRDHGRELCLEATPSPEHHGKYVIMEG